MATEEGSAFMGLDTQVKDLESSLDGLVKLGGHGSGIIDKLKWITTPREAELATAVIDATNQALKQANQTLQQLGKIAAQGKGA
jgi:hypothetical protein